MNNLNGNDLFFKAAIVVMCVILLGLTVIIAVGQNGISKNNSFSVSEYAKTTGESAKLNNAADKKSAVEKNVIRVVIKTEDFKDIWHEKVSMSAASGLLITVDGETDVIKSAENEVVDISSYERLLKDKKVIHVKSYGENDGIHINSLKRSCGNPAYYGSFDIYTENGKFVIVNEVMLENYIYGVVPSEMPDSYGLEALKAQAVCARSYAARRIMSPAYPEYNASVDDSVRYQVYNNYEITEKIKEAADATKGEVAVCKGTIIDAYFFASSCGATAGGEVWSEESGKISYLKSRMLIKEDRECNLWEEAEFENFINTEDENNFDSESSWYRWNICLDINKLSEEWTEKNGEFKKLEILERSSGGVITKLNVVGDKNTYTLTSEYDIREFLGKLIESGTNCNGKISSKTSMLPSACFYVCESADKKIMIKGGGYGHGVGLSQTAAKKMSEDGYNYVDILNMFYKGVEVTKLSL